MTSPPNEPPAPDDDAPSAAVPMSAHRLAHLERQLAHLLSEVAGAGSGLAADAGRLVPAWRRVTLGEQRLPVTLAVIVMILLQAFVPESLTLTASWVLPVVEGLILVVLVVSNPRRITHATRGLRALGLGLIAVASLANAWSAGSLVVGLVEGTAGLGPVPLLVTGANIWVTNIVVFALWYWELDRGGPAARARAERLRPDFLFPEMTAPDLADHDWEPFFVDYLYLAFTNATAFSPTDTLPFSRWSKLTMMLQSTVSLTTGALVIARAVNILKGPA